MDDINQEFGPKLLEKIKEEKIAPKPRWTFLLKESVIWGAGSLSLLVGGLVTAVVIYFFRDNSLNVYQRMDGSFLKFIFFTLPYFWLIFLALFIFVLYYNLKHTGRGYRYSVAAVAIISILLSLVLGVIFFQLGAGRLIDDLLGERSPLYPQVFNQPIVFWNTPEEGRLTGLVISRISDSEFILWDIDRQEWRVVSEAGHYFLSGAVEANRPIRIIGVKIDDNIFEAREILPVGPGRNFFHRFERDPRFHQRSDDQPGVDLPVGQDGFPSLP
jgi:hypothetical protein